MQDPQTPGLGGDFWGEEGVSAAALGQLQTPPQQCLPAVERLVLQKSNITLVLTYEMFNKNDNAGWSDI